MGNNKCSQRSSIKSLLYLSKWVWKLNHHLSSDRLALHHQFECDVHLFFGFSKGPAGEIRILALSWRQDVRVRNEIQIRMGSHAYVFTLLSADRKCSQTCHRHNVGRLQEQTGHTRTADRQKNSRKIRNAECAQRPQRSVLWQIYGFVHCPFTCVTCVQCATR